jgi:hypothetical protein
MSRMVLGGQLQPSSLAKLAVKNDEIMIEVETVQ